MGSLGCRSATAWRKIMMRTLTLFLLASSLVLAGCSHSKTAGTAHSQEAAADQAASSTADDHESLQGTWKMDGAVFNGQQMMNDVRWIIDSDHLTIVMHGNTQGGVRAEYELGTGDSPNTILIKLFNNPLA